MPYRNPDKDPESYLMGDSRFVSLNEDMLRGDTGIYDSTAELLDRTYEANDGTQTDYQAAYAAIAPSMRPADVAVIAESTKEYQRVVAKRRGITQSGVSYLKAKAVRNAKALASKPDTTGVRRILYRYFKDYKPRKNSAPGVTVALLLYIFMRTYNQRYTAHLLSHRRHRPVKCYQTLVFHTIRNAIRDMSVSKNPEVRRAAACLQWTRDNQSMKSEHRYYQDGSCQRLGVYNNRPKYAQDGKSRVVWASSRSKRLPGA